MGFYETHARAHICDCIKFRADIRKPFAVQPLSMRVHEGNRTEFQCAGPRGVPAPTVDWLRNGVPVVRNDSAAAAAVTLAANGSLIIARTALKVS